MPLTGSFVHTSARKSGPASEFSHCNACRRTGSELSTPLKRCPRCKSINYCSRECEIVDWRNHRGTCGRNLAAARGYNTKTVAAPGHSSPDVKTRPPPRQVTAATAPKPSSNSSSAPTLSSVERENENSARGSSLTSIDDTLGWNTEELNDVWGTEDDHDFALESNDAGIGRPGNMRVAPTVLKPSSSFSSEDLLDITGTRAWLSSLPEAVCYDAIIDAYRLRIEDEYVLTGKVKAGSLYAGKHPLAHFIHFVELARKERILPDYWSPEKSVACQQVALDEQDDSCILHAVDKGYILDKYKDSDPIVLEVLRIVADKVYGSALFALRLRFFEDSEGRGSAGWWG